MSFFCFSGSPNESGLNASLLGMVQEHLKNKNISCRFESMKSLSVPPYSPEEEKRGIPEGAKKFSALLEEAKGVIISCPEYNSSMPGNVKNLIDWVSRIRPVPLEKVKILLLSASPSMYGGYRGLLALKVPLDYLGAFVYPKFHAVSQADKTMSDPKRKESLLTLIDTFVAHVS